MFCCCTFRLIYYYRDYYNILCNNMSRGDDADLITEVEKFTWLYDRKHKHFKNKQMRENAWKTIAAVVNLTAGEAEQRFNQLRNRYNTEKRKLKVTQSGMEEDGTPTWYLYEAMQFLDKFIVARKTYGNVQADNNVSTCTMSQTTEPPLSQEWDTMSQIWSPPQTPEDKTETENNIQSATANDTESETPGDRSIATPGDRSTATPGDRSTATPESSRPGSRTATSRIQKKYINTGAATRGVPTRQVNTRTRQGTDLSGAITNAFQSFATFAERQQDVGEEEDEEEFFGKTVAKSLQRIRSRKNRARARIAILEILEEYETE